MRNAAQSIKQRRDTRPSWQKSTLCLDTDEDSPEEDHLELLSLLVESYENEHYPISRP
ncbi:uncharacterized protein METZ01_LOCUS224775 [marine metagenome]|uniref:Uncharacterized protein n=1 Tax=marine metagenome TaxID=408172 RepID=A0A382GCL1_9ZZZZ